MPIIKICIKCNKEFSVDSKRRAETQKRCSLECRKSFKAFNCLFCGKEGRCIQSKQQKYCDNNCRFNSLRTHEFIEKKCLNCETKFLCQPSKRNTKYCSRKCYFAGKIPMIGKDSRVCSGCGKTKKLTDFYKSKAHSTGRISRCIPCAREYTNNARMKLEYGISVKSFNSMLEKQNGVCAICKGVDLNKRLAIDHCHETGKIRGLLCAKCNTGIGLLQESVDILQTAINYLNKKAFN